MPKTEPLSFLAQFGRGPCIKSDSEGESSVTVLISSSDAGTLLKNLPRLEGGFFVVFVPGTRAR